MPVQTKQAVPPNRCRCTILSIRCQKRSTSVIAWRLTGRSQPAVRLRLIDLCHSNTHPLSLAPLFQTRTPSICGFESWALSVSQLLLIRIVCTLGRPSEPRKVQKILLKGVRVALEEHLFLHFELGLISSRIRGPSVNFVMLIPRAQFSERVPKMT